jgi:hypothetical protein
VRINHYRSTDPVRPLGDRRTGSIKLQWICSDRNIERVPKGLGRWDGLGKSRNRPVPVMDRKLLHRAPT